MYGLNFWLPVLCMKRRQETRVGVLKSLPKVSYTGSALSEAFAWFVLVFSALKSRLLFHYTHLNKTVRCIDDGVPNR